MSPGEQVRVIGSSSTRGKTGIVLAVEPANESVAAGPRENQIRISVHLDTPMYEGSDPVWWFSPNELILEEPNNK